MPLAPVALFAARYGAVALAGWAIARSLPQAPRDQRAEDSLDRLEEGVHVARDAEAFRVTTRICRVVRIGKTGPGLEVDWSVMSRLKLRAVKRSAP